MVLPILQGSALFMGWRPMVIRCSTVRRRRRANAGPIRGPTGWLTSNGSAPTVGAQSDWPVVWFERTPRHLPPLLGRHSSLLFVIAPVVAEGGHFVRTARFHRGPATSARMRASNGESSAA